MSENNFVRYGQEPMPDDVPEELQDTLNGTCGIWRVILPAVCEKVDADLALGVAMIEGHIACGIHGAVTPEQVEALVVFLRAFADRVEAGEVLTGATGTH